MTKSKRKYKVYKNKFAKLIKEYNQAIIKDDLWKGRFEMRIIRSRWEWFEDDSGGILHNVIRCFDKKTEQYKDFFIQKAKAKNSLVVVVDKWDKDETLDTFGDNISVAFSFYL